MDGEQKLSVLKQNKENGSEIADSRWKGLFQVGGYAALVAAVLLSIEILVFMVWPQPETVFDYFMLLQNNRLIGLLDLYLLEFFAYVLFIPMFLALFIALRRVNKSYMTIAATLAVVGIAIFLATNNPFSMLSLSDQYAISITDVDKSVLLAAGQAIITNSNQRAIGGFNMGFLLFTVAGLIISKVMFHSEVFDKTTGYVGILAFTVSLIDYFRIVFFPSFTVLLVIIAILSGLFLIIWMLLVAKGLLRIEKLLD